MFIDTAKIEVRAGKGGNGAVSFHREKYVPAGGPDGGDGGRGGSVVFRADTNLATLMDFRYKNKYAAENGANGGINRRSGKDGKDLVVRVPKGTLIFDEPSGRLICDLSDDEDHVIARGGRGGFGNARFATPTRQAPRFAKPGFEGQSLTIRLELKLLADVGLVGFPNAGKSTLLAAMSAARPKIANYHFTTLTPNLGVVCVGEGASFVLADIPGIIEGASEGAGLGLDFLRHIDRCRMLVHVVDAAGSEGRDPVEDITASINELRNYSPSLAERPYIVAANKTDIDEGACAGFVAWLDERDIEHYKISAATRAGVDALAQAIFERLKTLPPIETYLPDPAPEAAAGDGGHEIGITAEGGVFHVAGDWLVRLMDTVNFDDYESLNYFQRVLKNAGVFEKLEQAGVKAGDTVEMYGFEFDYL